jgi:alpha-1,3-rhamnosyltransferase
MLIIKQPNMVVSVGIVTFKSSLYVLDTLESVFNQTYANIELIISDDCSPDNTVEIVQKWCKQDKVINRFNTIKFLTVPKNTGVSANCNRIIKAAKTDWIKFIAGDDILLPNCIQENMAFAQSNPDAMVFFSQVKVHKDTFDDENYTQTIPVNFPDNLFHDKLSAKDQFQLLCMSDRIHFTPSSMFHKAIFDQVGYYDETNRLVEDYPMWLKLTAVGIRLHYFHKPTVGYRIHAQATNNTGNKVLFKPSIINNFSIRKQMCHQYLPWEIVASEYHIYGVSCVFSLLNWNKKTCVFVLLSRVCCFYLNPFHYIYA